MPVPPTEDNPHGWGYIEKRPIVECYQLSPRIQIVIGDVIKVSKGPYWVSDDGVKNSMNTMKGNWEVNGIFEGEDGLEMDIVQCWPGGLYGCTSTIRITGDEYVSPIVDVIVRRPHKIRLAKPKYKRTRKTFTERKEAVKSVEKKTKTVDKKKSLSDIAKIIEESKNG